MLRGGAQEGFKAGERHHPICTSERGLCNCSLRVDRSGKARRADEAGDMLSRGKLLVSRWREANGVTSILTVGSIEPDEGFTGCTVGSQ